LRVRRLTGELAERFKQERKKKGYFDCSVNDTLVSVCILSFYCGFFVCDDQRSVGEGEARLAVEEGPFLHLEEEICSVDQ